MAQFPPSKSDCGDCFEANNGMGSRLCDELHGGGIEPIVNNEARSVCDESTVRLVPILTRLVGVTTRDLASFVGSSVRERTADKNRIERMLLSA